MEYVGTAIATGQVITQKPINYLGQALLDRSTGSPVRFAHPASSSVVNTDDIELSKLSSMPRQVQSPHQPIYSYSSSIIDLNMMGLLVDHLAGLPLACCSTATLDGIV